MKSHKVKSSNKYIQSCKTSY